MKPTRYRKLNDAFSLHLAEAFKSKFSIELETSMSITTLQMVSYRKDERDFTKEQAAWLAAFESGYFTCAKEAA